MGTDLSVTGRCSAFLTSQSTRQVLQALVLSYLEYCPAVWSSAAKMNLGKLQLVVQNKAACISLRCTRREMSISPGSTLRRDWLHHYWSLCEVLMCWRYRTASSSSWHTVRTLIVTTKYYYILCIWPMCVYVSNVWPFTFTVCTSVLELFLFINVLCHVTFHVLCGPQEE